MILPNQPNLLIYKRFYRPIKVYKPPFFIFGSSSKGNSVYLKPFQTLIDIGLPVSAYLKINKDFFYDVRYIVITHGHSDHFNLSTFNYILKMYPKIKIIMSPILAKALSSIEFQYKERFYHKSASQLLNQFSYRIIIADHILKLRNDHDHNFKLIPYSVKHGPIINLAIALKDLRHRWLYSTDLSQTNGDINSGITGLPFNMSHPFDMIMLEANYDYHLVNSIIHKRAQNGKYSYAEQNKRHLSEQESFKYANLMLKNQGIYVPLHASKSFGNYSQNTNIQ